MTFDVETKDMSSAHRRVIVNIRAKLEENSSRGSKLTERTRFGKNYMSPLNFFCWEGGGWPDIIKNNFGKF